LSVCLCIACFGLKVILVTFSAHWTKGRESSLRVLGRGKCHLHSASCHPRDHRWCAVSDTSISMLCLPV